MKKIYIIAIFFLMPVLSNAQQSKVDSVIQLINKVKGNVLDSATYSTVYHILKRTVLTESQIIEIDTAAVRFRGGDYYIPFGRFGSLHSFSKLNEEKNYLFSKIEKSENIKSTYGSNIRASFLSDLRVSFLNENNFGEGFKYFTQKLNHYKNTNDSICCRECYYILADLYDRSGLSDIAIYNLKKSTSYIDTSKYKVQWESNMILMGRIYLKKKDIAKSVKYSAIAYNERLKRKRGWAHQAIHLAEAMLLNNQLDSAAYYIKKAEEDPPFKNQPVFLAAIKQLEGLYNIQAGDLNQAEVLLNKSWEIIKANNIQVNQQPGTIAPDYYLALIKIKQDKLDEAISLLYKDIERLQNIRLDVLRDYKLIAQLYAESGKYDKSAAVYAIFIAKQDSLLADQDKYRAFNFDAEQQMNEQERSIADLRSQNKVSALTRNFSIGTAALLLLLIAGVYYRYQSKKKANLVLNNTLSQLKSTQTQLIQSEKMASLGELTAGIAHEIQNPLNFVNNFSDVNREMLEELKAESTKPKAERDEQLETELINNLLENEQKINHHGKRADAIVKGMLQHSQSGSGTKEPTDINALSDEYLRLSYHGLRSKDKSFNAELVTNFEEKLPKVNVIPQDIGRVLLNLFNNAFYAVNQKQKTVSEDYKAEVSLSTSAENGQIIIKVKDNGIGIPEAIKEKIMQPFFTTKPTGEGTGLGLSLTYDMVVKGHGGSIQVNSVEGEGSEFTITLPIN